MCQKFLVGSRPCPRPPHERILLNSDRRRKPCHRDGPHAEEHAGARGISVLPRPPVEFPSSHFPVSQFLLQAACTSWRCWQEWRREDGSFNAPALFGRFGDCVSPVRCNAGLAVIKCDMSLYIQVVRGEGGAYGKEARRDTRLADVPPLFEGEGTAPTGPVYIKVLHYLPYVRVSAHR